MSPFIKKKNQNREKYLSLIKQCVFSSVLNSCDGDRRSNSRTLTTAIIRLSFSFFLYNYFKTIYLKGLDSVGPVGLSEFDYVILKPNKTWTTFLLLSHVLCEPLANIYTHKVEKMEGECKRGTCRIET